VNHPREFLLRICPGLTFEQREQKGEPVLGLILTLIILLVLLAALPSWPYSRTWGYGPSGVLAAILVILILLIVLNILPFGFGGPAVAPAPAPVVVD